MATFFAPKGVVANERDWYLKYAGVTASQTFGVGDFVYLVAAGTASIAATASNDVGNVLVLGLARASAADCLASGRECPIWCPKPGAAAWFLLPLYHSTAASAVLAASDLDLPTTLPLRNQAGQWCANKENDGTNDRVTIRERHLMWPYSEAAGWFWCSPTAAGWWGIGG